MLEIKYIRKNLPVVEQSLKARGADVDLGTLLTADEKRRTVLRELEMLRHQRNTVSDEIAAMKKAGENADVKVADMRKVSASIKSLDPERAQYENEIETILMGIPNIPHESVPVGNDEADNATVKKIGAPPVFDFSPLAHWEIGKNLGILDFDRAARITGARFPLYFGAGARLERALINFMLDTHTKNHGYREVLPPFIVNRESMTHTGQLPKFAEDLFKLEGWDYFLVPTAEVPVTNIHQNETIPEKELPILYTAYTPCFRSEAGSYGKDTRGLIRQHQFNKVELVHF
ncbi:MAG: serine--tRNA ligase, partial [Thermodesulfobacteriota bacterium]|nr:serine--tRNA ligase [Thermodesulfobacteriota bacterium]